MMAREQEQSLCGVNTDYPFYNRGRAVCRSADAREQPAVPTCRDQGWAAGSARGSGGSLLPSCPPLPENNQLVDAGASPADQRLATSSSCQGVIPPSSPGSGVEQLGQGWRPARGSRLHLGCTTIGCWVKTLHIFTSSGGADGAQSPGSALEVKFFASPDRLPELSFSSQNISSLGLQIFLLINYYASCQISIAITKRLIATMRCGTPLLQGNFLLFMLWHNTIEQSGRTTEHKFRRSPSAEEAILITAEGWQLAPNLLGASWDERRPTSLTPLTRQDRSRRLHVFIY